MGNFIFDIFTKVLSSSMYVCRGEPGGYDTTSCTGGGGPV